VCTVLLALLLAAGCERPGSGVAGNASSRPNILLVVADDLGVGDLGSYGNPDVETPNLDRLAATGLRFTRFYAAAATCSPARASLLTGQYPQRFGFRSSPRGLPQEVVTLPELLRDAGYATHHVGKWHLGMELQRVRPLAQGFDSFFGFLHARLLNPGGPRYTDPRLVSDEGRPTRFAGHLTDLLTDRAVALIEQGRDAPWFLNLWYFAPHSPLDPPPRWAARHPDDETGRYRALVSGMDEGVGRVLAALDRSDQARDTIVVFLSDNGGVRAESNHPFLGAKSQLLEGGVRVPLLLRAAGRFAPGVVDVVSSSMDLHPTLAGLAGVPLQQPVDGLDLTPVLAGGSTAPPARALFWENEMYDLARTRTIQPDRYTAHQADGLGRTKLAVLGAEGRWRLVRERPGFALFDLANDRAGSQNVWEAHPQRAQELLSQFRSWSELVRRIPVRAVTRGDARWDGRVATFAGKGRVDLLGHDVMRTPGHGAWTFGIGIEPAVESPDARVIAGQSDIWSLRRDARGQIVLKLGTERLELPGPAAGECAGVVVTALHRIGRVRAGRPKHVARLNLFANGSLVAASASAPRLRVGSVAAPTRLGGAGDERPGWVGALWHPTLLNAELPTDAAAELSKTLCARREAPGDASS
jgi:arylsulfatase A-like enzyme